jgi:hypothetical protein
MGLLFEGAALEGLDLRVAADFLDLLLLSFLLLIVKDEDLMRLLLRLE